MGNAMQAMSRSKTQEEMVALQRQYLEEIQPWVAMKSNIMNTQQVRYLIGEEGRLMQRQVVWSAGAEELYAQVNEVIEQIGRKYQADVPADPAPEGPDEIIEDISVTIHANDMTGISDPIAFVKKRHFNEVSRRCPGVMKIEQVTRLEWYYEALTQLTKTHQRVRYYR